MKLSRLIVSGLTMIFLLSGCTGTSTLYSNVFSKPSQPITEIKFLYLENKLQSKTGRSDSALSTFGYYDLPELLKERVPLILKMNGIAADYATFEKVNFGEKEKINSIKWSKSHDAKTGLLVLQFINGKITRSTRSGTHATLNMHVNLFSGEPKKRQWTGQFKNSLAKTPLFFSHFDNEYVDGLLKMVLEQMSNDGIIKLKDNKVQLPVYVYKHEEAD